MLSPESALVRSAPGGSKSRLNTEVRLICQMELFRPIFSSRIRMDGDCFFELDGRRLRRWRTWEPGRLCLGSWRMWWIRTAPFFFRVRSPSQPGPWRLPVKVRREIPGLDLEQALGSRLQGFRAELVYSAEVTIKGELDRVTAKTANTTLYPPKSYEIVSPTILDGRADPQGGVNGSQPIRAETNSTSATAGSRCPSP